MYIMIADTKRFTKNNESFVCISCGATVPEHPSSSRDHCNKCLIGLHVDINPGDRANSCRGILEPIGLKIRDQKQQIVYKCKSCQKKIFCIVAPDDNPELILELSTRLWGE